MDLEQAEQFFLGKIKNQATREGVEFTDIEEKSLFVRMTPSSYANLSEETRTFIEYPGNLKQLNNKVMLLLRHAMQRDLESASEIKSIRLGWLTWFKMPGDWYDGYMYIYDNSDKFITGILQNFVLNTPFR